MKRYLKNCSGFAYRLWSRLLDIIGDIKVFKYPLWIAYDPEPFQVVGAKMQDVHAMLKPGDVLLRGYDRYLDGHFIKGDYSHGAIYVGDDRIVHAVSPHVEATHPLDFMQCDRICVMRPKNWRLARKAVSIAERFLEEGTHYDFDFNTDDPADVYCFELVARCYPTLDFGKSVQKYIFGLVRRETYLASSFIECENFTRVFEYNPRRKVDFSSQK